MKYMKWLINGAGKGFKFHAIIPALSLMVTVLLVKLKNLSIQYAWIIMKKQNSNQNVKVEKMVVFVKDFDHYHPQLIMALLIIAIYTVLFEIFYTVLI